jgi:hypothetical protein
MLPRSFSYHQRRCDACGANAFTSLWQNIGKAATRNYVWNFHVNVGVCQRCGFCFVSPCPSDTQLLEYYADAFLAIETAETDFDIEKRLSLIDDHRRPTHRRVLEIGGNRNGLFQTQLATRFTSVEMFEPNSDAQSVSWEQIGIVDYIVSYFVLECSRTSRISKTMRSIPFRRGRCDSGGSRSSSIS